MSAAPHLDADACTPAAVLEQARAARAVAEMAEAELLALAADWASMHSGETVPEDDDPWAERALDLAGPGAPELAEFCVAEFALAVGKNSDAGRSYLGQALELRYRLPRVWRRVQSGEVPAWRARRIAQATICLPIAGAASVDIQVAPVAHSVGVVALDRLVEEARVRFDPEEAEARLLDSGELRRADVRMQDVAIDGIVHIDAAVDLPDAVDLEAALKAGAAQLAAEGSTDPLDVRRAKALELLARGQLQATDEPVRRVSLHVHASADPGSPLVRIEETRSFVMIDRLAEWCLDPATQLDVAPVRDLADHVHTESYEVPDRLARQPSCAT